MEGNRKSMESNIGLIQAKSAWLIFPDDNRLIDSTN